MKRSLSVIAFTALLTSCTTIKVVKVYEPKERFTYPLVVETNAPVERVWAKLVDVIAVKGYPISRLDKENGLFISGRLVNSPFVIENSTPSQDTTAYVTLPRIRRQEKSNGSVQSSRMVYPDSLSFVFNVRVRSNGSGGAFVNVNILDISIGGGHYLRKPLSADIPTDSVFIKTPVSVKRGDWDSAKSTGKLENTILQAIKGGEVRNYTK